jgi:hypothetical protein
MHSALPFFHSDEQNFPRAVVAPGTFRMLT